MACCGRSSAATWRRQPTPSSSRKREGRGGDAHEPLPRLPRRAPRAHLAVRAGRPTVKLQRPGANGRRCCPFHNEKTPSFYVNDDKGFYHCFGCGAHGDAIRWMTDQRGLPFMDAVKELAAGRRAWRCPRTDPRAGREGRARQGPARGDGDAAALVHASSSTASTAARRARYLEQARRSTRDRARVRLRLRPRFARQAQGRAQANSATRCWSRPGC